MKWTGVLDADLEFLFSFELLMAVLYALIEPAALWQRILYTPDVMFVMATSL